MRRLLLGTLALTPTLLSAGAALGTTPVGAEFQVNTYTTSSQYDPSVAVDADGDFVVVWTSDGSLGSDTSYSSIQAQRYASDGTAVGGQFQVNTYTTSSQYDPSVAIDMGGDFVVVWASDGSSGSDTSSVSIQARRYASNGAAVGGQFQVNTYTTGQQFYPSVAVDADGDFAVVWESYGGAGSDTSPYSIQGQRYDTSGNALGGEFQVNTYITSYQRSPSVAVDADGDFAVVWESYGGAGSDTSLYSIQGQRYDTSGNAVGDEFQVNTYTTSSQYNPSVALDADGDFVVVWDSNGSAGSDSDFSIQGQRYGTSGNAVGGEFQINTYTPLSQYDPSVALGADGNFVVVWTSNGSASGDTSFFSIQGQRYSASGSAVGPEFQVNSYTTASQRYPSVAADAEGAFVVVWTSNGSAGSDSSSFSIQAQRYLPEPSQMVQLGSCIVLLLGLARRRGVIGA